MPLIRRAPAGGAPPGPAGVLRRLAPLGDRRPLTRSWLLTLCVVLVGVALLGVVAVRFAPTGSFVAVWWPAAGLSASFLLTTGPDGRRAGLVVLGVALHTERSDHVTE